MAATEIDVTGPRRFHPVQTGAHVLCRELPESVVLKAYEVYCALYGEQQAMLDLEKGCRGGFTSGEIIAFLYAHCFPRAEWQRRVDEAFEKSK